MTLGEKIKQARTAKGLKQSELAKLVGVKNPSVVSNWEIGNSLPETCRLVSLCEALGISLTYLLDYDQGDGFLTVAEEEHMQMYRALDDLGRRMVNATLRVEHKRTIDNRKHRIVI